MPDNKWMSDLRKALARFSKELEIFVGENASDLSADLIWDEEPNLIAYAFLQIAHKRGQLKSLLDVMRDAPEFAAIKDQLQTASEKIQESEREATSRRLLESTSIAQRLSAAGLANPATIYPLALINAETSEKLICAPQDADSGSATSWAQRCLNHLVSSGQLPNHSSKTLVILRGPNGAGKSTLLHRLLASGAQAFSRPFLIDLVIKKEQFILDNERENLTRLCENLNVDNSTLIGIDGIDEAARYIVTTTGKGLAHRLVYRVLAETVLRRVRPDATVVVGLNVPSNDSLWSKLFDDLRGKDFKCITWDVSRLPVQDDHFLSAHASGTDAGVVKKACVRMPFLELPIYFDAFNKLDEDDRNIIETPLSLLKESAENRNERIFSADTKGQPECHHVLYEVAAALEEFRTQLMNSSPDRLMRISGFRSRLSSEWTGPWVYLLAEEAKQPTALRQNMANLLEHLLKWQHRWTMSGTYAISNLISILVESGGVQFPSKMAFCNLRQANLRNVSFKKIEIVACDLSNASLEGAKKGRGARFIACDFSGISKESLDPSLQRAVSAATCWSNLADVSGQEE